MELKKSGALSMINTVKGNIVSRKIAILAADGVNGGSVAIMKDAVKKAGATAFVIAPHLGSITTESNETIAVDESYLTAASVLYDAVYVPGGNASVHAVAAESNAIHFLNQSFKHCKAIAADTDAHLVLQNTYFANELPSEDDQSPEAHGLLIGANTPKLAKLFIAAIGQQRFWEREVIRRVPA